MYHSQIEESEKKQEKQNIIPNLTGIPFQLKTKFENTSGLSFDDVRVHYNSNEPAKVNALAYTRGNDIYMGKGQEKHLSHELGHVVQQKAGIVQPTTSIAGFLVNDDPKLEQQADNIGKLPIQRKMHPVVQRLRIRLDNDEKENETFAAMRKIKINPATFNETISILDNSKLSINKSLLNPKDLKIKENEEKIGNINDTAASKRLQKSLTPNITVPMGCCEKFCEYFSFSKDAYHDYGPENNSSYTLKECEDIIFEGHGTDVGIAHYTPKDMAQIAFNIIKKCGYSKEKPWKGRVILFGCSGGQYAKDVASILHLKTNFKVSVMGPDRRFGVLSYHDIKYGMGEWLDRDKEKPENYKEMYEYSMNLCTYLGKLYRITNLLEEMVNSLKNGRKNINEKKIVLAVYAKKVQNPGFNLSNQNYFLEYLEGNMPNTLKDIELKGPALIKLHLEEQLKSISLKKKGKKQLEKENEDSKEEDIEDDSEYLDRSDTEEIPRLKKHKITNISVLNTKLNLVDEIEIINDYLNLKTNTIEYSEVLKRLSLIKTDVNTAITDYFTTCGVPINFDKEESVIKEEVGADE